MIKKKKNGFTLVELLAVIVILALLLIIVIPSILDTTNRAKKELFYDYSRSVQSKAVAKYIQDMDDETIKSNCRVYDINTDLDLENTGDFEGWAKVNRRAVENPDKRTAVVKLPTVPKVLNVMYCIADGTDCKPDTQFMFADGATQVNVDKNIKKGQVLCAYAEYPENNQTKITPKSCKTYDNAEKTIDSYEYDVIITIKDRERAVNNVNFSDNTSKSDFYKAIDDFKEAAKSKKVNPMAIASPTCSANDPVTYKGTTTIKNETTTTTTTQAITCPGISAEDNQYEIVLNPNGGTINKNLITQCVDCGSSEEIETPVKAGYIFDGWYYDKAFSKKLTGNQSSRVESEPKKGANNCIEGYNRVYLYAKWTLDESKTTTTPPVQTTTPNTTSPDETSTVTTEEVTQPTTVRDTSDETLRLSSLVVSGYDINFDPVKYDYRVEVPYSQTSIAISATANTPEVTDVTVEDSKNLGVGNNVILVNLQNRETNKSTFYRVVVVRLDEGGKAPTNGAPTEQPEWDPSSGVPDPSLDESNASLKLLQVSGYDFRFDPNVYNYDLDVVSLDPLTLSYQPATKGAYVTVIGNENLKDGSEIEVVVVSANGFYTKRYKITIRYNKAVSAGTRYLRNLAILLGIILAIILVISRSNKFHKNSLIKKKDDTNNQNPMDGQSNIQNNNNMNNF